MNVKEWIKCHPFRSYIIYFFVACLINGIANSDILSSLFMISFIILLIRAIRRKIKNKKEGIKFINKENAEKQEKINTEITQSIKDGTFTPIKVDIPLEKEEDTYGVYGTALIKEKKVTTRTNYGGMTGSIKIMKGMRYRLGSIQHQSESHIEEYRADTGILYVTNKRFIFKGDKQVIEIKAKDMMTMEVTGNFVKIFKKKGNAIKLEFVGEHSTFGAVMMGLNNKE